jgi:hypothetical protein
MTYRKLLNTFRFVGAWNHEAKLQDGDTDTALLLAQQKSVRDCQHVETQDYCCARLRNLTGRARVKQPLS